MYGSIQQIIFMLLSITALCSFMIMISSVLKILNLRTASWHSSPKYFISLSVVSKRKSKNTY